MISEKIRKAPILNVLFGAGAIAEAITRALQGDLEAATHSLYAAGYNFASGLIPYLPTLDRLQNSDKEYVNIWGAIFSGGSGIVDNIIKNLPDYAANGEKIGDFSS